MKTLRTEIDIEARPKAYGTRHSLRFPKSSATSVCLAPLSRRWSRPSLSTDQNEERPGPSPQPTPCERSSPTSRC